MSFARPLCLTDRRVFNANPTAMNGDERHPADPNRVCRGPRWDECVPWGMQQHQMRGHSGVTMHKSFVFGVTGGEWGIAEIAETATSSPTPGKAVYHKGHEGAQRRVIW